MYKIIKEDEKKIFGKKVLFFFVPFISFVWTFFDVNQDLDLILYVKLLVS